MIQPQVKVMGVINLTPDSFSDAGTYFSGPHELLLQKFQSLKEQGVDIPDVGAQSTAPSAMAIDAKTEVERLSGKLLPLLESKQWPWPCLSLDTYRVSTASAIFEKWQMNYPQGSFYFNDVSGVLDEELAQFLTSKTVLSSAQNMNYIFTSTYLKQREQTSQHLKFSSPNISEKELVNHIQGDWERVADWWKHKGIKSNLILDPGFGFSKTREQNLYLLNHPEHWMPKSQEHQVLWGISRKSFLRPPGMNLVDHPELLPEIEALHKNLSHSLFAKFPSHQFIWRLHDPILCSIVIDH